MNEEVILKLYKNQAHAVKTGGFTGKMEVNASCGDEVGLQLELEKDIITKATFYSSSCSVTNASAEFLCSEIEGKKLTEIKIKELEAKGLNRLEMTADEKRATCALLPYRALETVLQEI